MTALEEIKKALEGVGPLKVEFTPDCEEFNAIIAPINDDYDGTFFTVIGCGDKQDKLGGFMAIVVNALPELLSTLESLQRENEELRKGRDHIAAEKAGIAKNAHSNVDYWLSQFEAAEAEVKRLEAQLALSKPVYSRRQLEARVNTLEKALKPFADVAQYYDPPEEDENQKLWGMATMPTIGNVRDARTALASTGGEHHAE